MHAVERITEFDSWRPVTTSNPSRVIDPEQFYTVLTQQDVSYYCGVPDSLLKDFCAFLSDRVVDGRHIVAANEGAALALAAGYHLATGKVGLVYLQNSGMGNLVNPLTSLVDPEVYSIPAILLIGWRGEPGVQDEPQHVKQGRVTLELLRILEIPWAVVPTEPNAVAACLGQAAAEAVARQGPYALVVRKGTFAPYSLRAGQPDRWSLRREDALKLIMECAVRDAVFVSTTGMTSREVYEYRTASAGSHERDFLTVGCMGHASQIALGIASQRLSRNVICLDGDGAVIMHMGALAVIGTSKCRNLKHIIINNGAHDSVGGQPTAGFLIDLCTIATACGYRWVARASSGPEIVARMREFEREEGPALLEIMVNRGARENLGRPTSSPGENKREFMRFLQA